MIIYHILVTAPQTNRVMHESYYTDHKVAVNTADWWINKAKMNVETWIAYGRIYR